MMCVFGVITFGGCKSIGRIVGGMMNLGWAIREQYTNKIRAGGPRSLYQ